MTLARPPEIARLAPPESEPIPHALREPSAHPHICTSALLHFRKARSEPSASLFVSHTASLFVSQIPSPTRPKVNLDGHCSLGLLVARLPRVTNSERNARSCLSRFLVYTVTVSIIDASAQSFRLAYIDILSFSLVSLMLADAISLTRRSAVFTS